MQPNAVTCLQPNAVTCLQPNAVTSQYKESEGARISLDVTVFNVKAKNLWMHYVLVRNRILFASFQSLTVV
jgi:AAA+ superfamily predicted ATPase